MEPFEEQERLASARNDSYFWEVFCAIIHASVLVNWALLVVGCILGGVSVETGSRGWHTRT